MSDIIAPAVSSGVWSTPTVVVLVAVSAVLLSRVARLVTRRVIRRLARRSLLTSAAAGLWRARVQRPDDSEGDTGEQRRRQRIDAASRMVNHLVSLVIWVVAAIVTFHLLDIDPAFFLSSAGFLGAALAIGGQHKVNDYLTGLSVHFEDRYGVGDEILAEVGWAEPVRGVVDHVGLFSTRLRNTGSTVHVSNSALSVVRNLSQEACRTTLRVRVGDDEAAGVASSLLRGLAGTAGLTDVVFIGDLEANGAATGEVDVEVATSRSLGDVERDRLVRRAEAALRSD